MTCKWCHDDPHKDPPCGCACHFTDTEGIQMGLKRCDDERV